MKPIITNTLSCVTQGSTSPMKKNNGRIQFKNVSKGILILLISLPSFAGNSKLDAGKNCPSSMKCMVQKAEENMESMIQPAELATTVLCRFLIN